MVGSPSSPTPNLSSVSPAASSPSLQPSSPNSNRFGLSLGGFIRRPRGNTIKANNPPSPTGRTQETNVASAPASGSNPSLTNSGAASQEEGRSNYFPGLRRKGSRRLLSFGGHPSESAHFNGLSSSSSGVVVAPTPSAGENSASGGGSNSPNSHHHHLFSTSHRIGSRRSSSQPPSQLPTPFSHANNIGNENSDGASPPMTSPRNFGSNHQRSQTAVHGSHHSLLPNISVMETNTGSNGLGDRLNDSSSSNPTTDTINRPSTADGAKRVHLRLVPHLDSTRSLHFEPIERAVLPGGCIKIGRFTERNGGNPSNGPDAVTSPKVAFHSKVVSRTHAEIHLGNSNSEGSTPTFQIKDTCSSSGTFLNHLRLSGPGLESRLFSLRDGDVIQLGVDYQGGTEEQYRCVKIRVEIGGNWQKGPSTFNKSALEHLRALSVPPKATANSAGKSAVPADTAEALTDCCICWSLSPELRYKSDVWEKGLYPINVCQALFIAPCSHTTHFKCIRPMINLHYPGFSCPLCRTFANLDADVEIDPEPVEEPSSAEDDDAKAGLVTSVPPDGPAFPFIEPDFGTLGAGTLVNSNPASLRPTVQIPPVPHLTASTSLPAQSPISQVLSETFHQEADNRRSSIIISGANGTSVPFSITGRNRGSRPGSIRDGRDGRPASLRNGVASTGVPSITPMFPVTFDSASPTSAYPNTPASSVPQRVPSSSALANHSFTHDDLDESLMNDPTIITSDMLDQRTSGVLDEMVDVGTPQDHQTLYTGGRSGGEGSRGRSGRRDAEVEDGSKRDDGPGTRTEQSGVY